MEGAYRLQRVVAVQTWLFGHFNLLEHRPGPVVGERGVELVVVIVAHLSVLHKELAPDLEALRQEELVLAMGLRDIWRSDCHIVECIMCQLYSLLVDSLFDDDPGGLVWPASSEHHQGACCNHEDICQVREVFDTLTEDLRHLLLDLFG